MVRRILFGFYTSLGRLLQSPSHVLWLCLGLLLINCVLDGSFLRLWSLHRDQQYFLGEVTKLRDKNAKLRMMIQKASDPSFIEREARDRFDLVEEGDLVFVFSEDS